ncbi:hypothetical protein [Methanocalculus natronophilus]|uniref:hypothetical protein n=1 Tax=Methanocalculus natronophilus TaxID=1262400 RepID=UPI0031B5D65D
MKNTICERGHAESGFYHLFRRVRQIEEETDTGFECRIMNYIGELQDITRLFGLRVEKYYA